MPNEAGRANTYRFKGVHAFITLPQAAGIELNDLYRYYQTLDYGNKELIQILVAQESHQDGEPHFHIYLRWDNQFNTRDVRFFDYGGKHPNVQSARSAKAVIEYCTKDGNFKAEKKVGGAWRTWEIKVKVTWADVHATTTETEFWDTVVKADPRAAIINYSPIKRAAKRKFDTFTCEYEVEYERHQFPNETYMMSAWVSEHLEYVSFLANLTGSGLS